MKYKPSLKNILLHGASLVLILIILFPIYLVFSMSLKSPSSIINQEWIFTPTLMNYQAIFAAINAQRYFFNSLIISVTTMIIALALAILAGYSLARFKFKGSENLSSWMLTLLIFPPIVPCIAFWVLFKNVGLIDTHIGVALTHLTFILPFSIWLLRIFFMAIPQEYEESARIDGCSDLEVLRRVTLPLAIPGIISTFLLGFLFSWSDLTFALVVAPHYAQTLPVLSITYLGIRGALYWGNIAALTAISFVPLMILSLVFKLDERIAKGFLVK